MHIGIDIGGTKLAAIALDADGRERARLRQPTPTSFDGVIDAVAEVVARLEAEGGRAPGVGISLPGIITRAQEISMIVNLPWLEGTPLRQALEARLGRPVTLANDANCFALSEATDGAGSGAEVVFGVILGTGVGGALVVRGEIVVGANATAGEWGHNPWPTPGAGGVPCTCGRFAQGCVETWLNGAALARDYAALGGGEATAEEIAARADAGDARAGTPSPAMPNGWPRRSPASSTFWTPTRSCWAAASRRSQPSTASCPRRGAGTRASPGPPPGSSARASARRAACAARRGSEFGAGQRPD